MRRALTITLYIISLVLISCGIYTVKCGGSAFGPGHLQSRIEQATEPILEKIRRTPKYVEEFGQREKELNELVDTAYAFAREAEIRSIGLSMKVTGIGVIQIILGIMLIVIAWATPKLNPMK